MTSYSPYGSTPGADYYYEPKDKFASPSPTPSPRGPYYYAQTPQRPATRAHFRGMSGGFNEYSPRPPTAFSPRYTSDGQYATANVSPSRSTRKHSSSGPRPKRERRNSYSYYRPSDSHGESDEDEYIEINGITYVMPARSKSRRYKESYYYDNAGGYRTNHHYHEQAGYASATYASKEAAGGTTPRRDSDAHSHSRRASASIPRPQTVRPGSSHNKASSKAPSKAPSKAAAPPSTPSSKPKATEADAKKHRIPAGYSLKYWDPTEEPIMLLGSVFDANSLGKWIYDWTVYRHGPSTPISDMAGELWLLLIQLSGKLKRSEEVVPTIRSSENKEMVEDFIESGERLTDKLRKVLKTCETPMLTAASRKKSAQLGKNSGIEFVETLFGRERELERTERFMQSVRLWNLRFDANCEEILRKPTA